MECILYKHRRNSCVAQKLGKQKIENDTHNDQVAKNWRKVKYALIAAGVGSELLAQFKHFLGE
jgi:hypothetical protein